MLRRALVQPVDLGAEAPHGPPHFAEELLPI
jgi:hypothetical protein